MSELAQNILNGYAALATTATIILLLLWLDELHWRKYHAQKEDEYFSKYLNEKQKRQRLELRIRKAIEQ